MITFPNAKINLGLSITEKRPDGYHNLENRILPRRSRRCAGNPDQPRSGQKVLPASVRNGDIR